MCKGQRFTLVELMVVVAIIAVLAAIAIPAFHTMQLRSKRAEVPLCSEGILDAIVAYATANDEISPDTVWNPLLPVNKTARAWVDGTNFETVGWRPDGKVRGSYLIGQTATCGTWGGPTYTAGTFAMSDIDGDGSTFQYYGCLDPSTLDHKGFPTDGY